MDSLRIALCIGVSVLFVVPAQVLASEGPPVMVGQESAQQLGFMSHIDHIIFVVLENHAYDNYFGDYCPTTSSLCPYAANAIPQGTCVPYNPANPTGPCITPWNFTEANWTVNGIMPHGASASAAAWNHGAMNGFYKAESSGLNPFGHYNGTTAPIVWDLAEEYALGTNFFSSVLSYSLPNHWHIVAGQAPQVVFDNYTECKLALCNVNKTLVVDHTYLTQANQTKSVEDLLLGSPISWKYYDFTLGNYSSAIKINMNAAKSKILSVGKAYNLYNPQAAKAESYNASFVNHYVLNTQFYADASAGTLPNVAWVIPPGQDSDHPPDNSTVAQGWLASVVDAVEASPEWNSTALYITWDDFGGFYDHVDPPKFHGQQLGFRVPLLQISAWTRPGFVSDQMGFFESILHLMEWRFGLGCIGLLDCNAPLPLWGFDWNLKAPNPPMMFPTNITSASYPYNPDWNGTTQVPTGRYVPPTEYTYFPEGQAPDID
jgi:phospholipase C